jgi:predicted nucleic acid-binding protein
MKLFIDTCALVAMSVPEDPYNNAAKSEYRKILHGTFSQLTSDYVLDETYTLLSARRGHHKAVAFMDSFDNSGVEVLRLNEPIELDAKKLFRKYDFSRLSFTDCTTVALINAHRISHLFTFDEHFNFFRYRHPVIILGQST